MNMDSLKRIYKATNKNTQPVYITKKQACKAYNKLLADGYLEPEDGYNYYKDASGDEYLKVILTQLGMDAIGDEDDIPEYLQLTDSQKIDIIMRDLERLPQPATENNIKFYNLVLSHGHAIIENGEIVCV